MLLKSIKVENFFSIVDLEIDFTTIQNPVLIAGPNTAGKSSILEAIRWCVTGKTHRGVVGDSVCRRNKNKEDLTQVTCVFDLGGKRKLKINRYRGKLKSDKKNGLNVYLNDVNKTCDPRTQEYLYKLIGYSEKSLISSMYFGQGASGLSSVSDTDLKALIEDILGIEDYRYAQKEAEKDVEKYEWKIEELKKKYHGIDRDLEDEECDLQDLKDAKKAQSKIKEIKSHKKILTDLKKDHKKQEDKLNTLKIKYHKECEVKCEACGQFIGTKTKKAIRYKVKIDKLTREIDDIETKHYREEHELFRLEAEEKANKEALERSESKIIKKIKKLKKSKKEIKLKIDKFERKLARVKFWVEGFGPTGLRDHLLRSMFPELNVRLKEFLLQLTDQPIYARFAPKLLKSGEQKIGRVEVLVSTVDGEVELKSCCGGERKWVDIALGLTLGCISSCKTLLFDEWFDTLDEESTLKAYELLKVISKDRLIVIITHNDKFEPTLAVNKTASGTEVIQL